MLTPLFAAIKEQKWSKASGLGQEPMAELTRKL
jgi:hypothetical protein